MTGSELSDPAPTPPATNRKAVLSIVLGVCAFAAIYAFPVAGIALGVPSVTTGVHARREIVASKGAQTGDSLAVIGLMIGGGAIATVLLSLVVARL